MYRQCVYSVVFRAISTVAGLYLCVNFVLDTRLDDDAVQTDLDNAKHGYIITTRHPTAGHKNMLKIVQSGHHRSRNCQRIMEHPKDVFILSAGQTMAWTLIRRSLCSVDVYWSSLGVIMAWLLYALFIKSWIPVIYNLVESLLLKHALVVWCS